MNNEEKNVQEQNNQETAKFDFAAWWSKLATAAKAGIIAGVAVIVIVPIILALVLGGGTNNGGANNGGAQNPSENTYTLALAVEASVGSDNKVSNYVAALVLDENDKIVAVRIDCVETTPEVAEGAIVDVASVASKVTQGDNYSMTSGSFAKQTKAFEDAIVGKTAAEVADLDMTLVAGCTMPYSPYSFKAVVAKAFASTNKTTFKTAKAITLGVAADMSVSGGKVTTYYAATVVVDEKIAADIIDCNEFSFTVTDGVAVAGEYAGTKVEQGDNYSMTSGSFAKQTEAFENAIVGKTSDEVASLDMTLVAGCTMPYSPYSFKTVVANAIANAR